jgi:hypothetical protein
LKGEYKPGEFVGWLQDISDAKRKARRVGLALKTCDIGYLAIVLASVAFALWAPVDLATPRAGSLSIFLATALSAGHFLFILSVNSYFETKDPLFGAWRVSRPRKEEELRERKMLQRAVIVRTAHEKVQKPLSKLMNRIVIWESIVLSIGTLVWGFADLIVAPVCEANC